MGKNAEENKTIAPDLLAEAKLMLAEAEAMKAEAEKLKAEVEAKEKMLAEAEAAKTVAAPAVNDDDEMVTVQLFKDSKDYKDDLTVGVNGEFIKIQRGKPVQIKKKFARVIDQSNLQDAATAELIERKSSEFEREAAKYN